MMILWIHQKMAMIILGCILLCLLIPAARADFFTLKNLVQQRDDARFAQSLDGVSVPWQKGFLEQRLDHFDALNHATFRQVYYVNAQWYTPGRPIFLYIGGEGQLSPRSVANGFATVLAEEHGALLVALEHRFYGESVPGPLTPKYLRFLSSQQALHDLVYFIEALPLLLPEVDLSEVEQLFTIGGSYPGSLSAWMRLKFPHLVTAALASSAPVRAKSDFFEYDQMLAAALGRECTASLQAVTQHIEHQLNATDSRRDMKALFGCTSVADDTAFMYVLVDTIAYVVQYSNPGVSYLDQLRNADFIAPSTPVEAKVAFFANFTVNTLFSGLGASCSTFDITSDRYKDTAKPPPESNTRQWMWQSCTEMGYWQTAPSTNSVRSQWITEKWHFDKVCKGLFGSTFQDPTDAFNAIFGADTIDQREENIFFTNGWLDPWKALSVTGPFEPSALSPLLMIDNAAHCSDLGAASPNDPTSLTEARQMILAFFRRQVQLAEAEVYDAPPSSQEVDETNDDELAAVSQAFKYMDPDVSNDEIAGDQNDSPVAGDELDMIEEAEEEEEGEEEQDMMTETEHSTKSDYLTDTASADLPHFEF